MVMPASTTLICLLFLPLLMGSAMAATTKEGTSKSSAKPKAAVTKATTTSKTTPVSSKAGPAKTTSSPASSKSKSGAASTKTVTKSSSSGKSSTPAKSTTQAKAPTKSGLKPSVSIKPPTKTKPKVVSKPAVRTPTVATIDVSEIKDFYRQPEPIQQMIRSALALTKLNLTYTFGSADPRRGGMDCSGTIYYLLRSMGYMEVPRQSDQICEWVMAKSFYHKAEGVTDLNDAALASLRPGALVFWTGTYATKGRAIPISHVMIYLGTRISDGQAVVLGASDGRRYEGQRRCGVSVFDFRLPKADAKASFHGYGMVPGLVKETIRKSFFGRRQSN